MQHESVGSHQVTDIREVYITPIGPDIPLKDIGLRRTLMARGVLYNVKVAPLNSPGENKVSVFVEGKVRDIERFCQDLREYKLDLPLKPETYNVEGPLPHQGDGISFEYLASVLIAEEIQEGSRYLREISEHTKGIPNLPAEIAKALKENNGSGKKAD